MQIFFLPDLVMFLLFVFLWLIIELGSAFLCLRLPDSSFLPDGSFYRPASWEDGGAIYDRFFRVSRWKKWLPDGGGLLKGGYKKKNLTDFSSESLKKFCVESARAEAVHWLCFIGFPLFGLFGPPIVILYMFLFAFWTNIPCIIAQRYNRPRILRTLEKMNYRKCKQVNNPS